MSPRVLMALLVLVIFTGILQRAAYGGPAPNCETQLGALLKTCDIKPENEQAACRTNAGILYRQCLEGIKPTPPPPKITVQECYTMWQYANRACLKDPVLLKQRCSVNARTNLDNCLKDAGQ